MREPFGRPLAILVTCGVLAACSPPDDTVALEEPEARRTFGPEENRIASKLSLGTDADQTEFAELDRSLACSVALETLTERLTQGGSLAPEVMQALDQAGNIYATRARVGLSNEEAEEARAAAEEVMPEEGDRARLAIGCLRDLA